MHEQLELADAIDWALDRAARDPNLLIVVTADHATGSMGISEQANIKGILEAKASSEGLSKGFGDLSTPEGKAGLAEAVLHSHGVKLSKAELDRICARAGSKYFASTVLGHLLSEHFGVYYFQPELQEDKLVHTHGHDGSHVPVFASGPRADLFAGTYENNEIPRKIAAILGLDEGIEPDSPLKAKSATPKRAAKRPSYFK
jgi:alkaline phosphatase